MKRSPLGIIFLTVFLDLVGFGIVLPLLPRFAADYYAAEWQIGLLMATYSLMQFVCAPLWGRLSDRIGRRPVLLLSITGSALSYLLFAFAPGLPLLFLSRLLAGAMAANLGTAQAYVADVTSPQDRARGMGMVGAAIGLGFVFGPALAGGISHWAELRGVSPQLAVGLAAAGFSLTDVLLAAFLLPESLPAEARSSGAARRGSRLQGMARTLRSRSLGLPVVVFFVSTVAWSQLEPTLARLSQSELAFTPAETGWMFAFLGLVVALVQGGGAGRLSKTMGEGRMVVTGTLLMAVGLALLPASVRWAGAGGLYAVLAVLGTGQALNLPGLQSLISRRAAAGEQGETLGVTQGFSSLARAVGPALGGLLYGVEVAYPFMFGAALMVVAYQLAGRLAAGKTTGTQAPAAR